MKISEALMEDLLKEGFTAKEISRAHRWMGRNHLSSLNNSELRARVELEHLSDEEREHLNHDKHCHHHMAVSAKVQSIKSALLGIELCSQATKKAHGRLACLDATGSTTCCTQGRQARCEKSIRKHELRARLAEEKLREATSTNQ